MSAESPAATEQPGFDFVASIANAAGAAEAAATVPATAPEPAPIATPTTEPVTQPLAPPVVPVAEPAVDKFAAVTAPTPELWAELLAERNTVKAQAETAQPLVAKITALGGEHAIEAVAPYFRPLEGDTEDAQRLSALTNGREVSAKLYEHDPTAYLGLAEAVWEKYRTAFFKWSLEEQGIKPDDFQAFQTWKANPQATIPAGYGPIGGAFPTLVEKDGQYESVVLPDGTPLDPNDPVHRLLYTQAKENFETKQTTAAATARTQQEQQAAAQQAEQQAIVARVDTFLGDRDKVIDTQLSTLTFAEFGEDAPKVIRDVKAQLRIALEEDSNLSNLIRLARDDVARGAVGKAQGAAVDIDRRNLELFNKIKADVETHWKEHFHYKSVAHKGAPVPPLTTRVEPVDTAAAPKPANTADAVWAQAIAALPDR